jgi:dihydrofolate reductase
MFDALDAAPTAAGVDADLVARAWDGVGAETIRAFLDADLVDAMHLVIVPIVLGRGQRLWDGQEGLEERFDVEVSPGGSGVTHLLLNRRRAR